MKSVSRQNFDTHIKNPSSIPRFLFKAKKAALIAAPPVVPTMPRLVEDVVPDDRDDVDIILNTTTVRREVASHILTYHLSALVTHLHVNTFSG